jgi:hypothetical protein
MKQTIFDNNNNYTVNRDSDPALTDDSTIKQNMTNIVQNHLTNRANNKLLNAIAPDIDDSEQTLPHGTRRRLAQLRNNKSSLLRSYLHKIDTDNYTTDICPLCYGQTHDTRHLFDCNEVPTRLVLVDLWRNPVDVAALWGEKLGWPPDRA